MEHFWYLYELDDVWEHSKSKPNGLSSTDASDRLKAYGPNRLTQSGRKGLFSIIVGQLRDFMILILLAAALISGLVGEWADVIIIVLIVVLNALIGAIQEFRAEKAIESLQSLATPLAMVLRDGVPTEISSDLLVPGDVVLLQNGNLVPADMRLVECHNLQILEAVLTGESNAILKQTEPLMQNNLGTSDQRNMVFKGTAVVYGRGAGVVVATGMQTELGKIAGMLHQTELLTPLQIRLQRFGKKLTWLVLALCVMFFLVGYLRGEDLLTILLTGISLAVAALPEALPAVVTISLALGAKRMLKRKTLIRNLPAVETLGSVTHICFDKTGTLTLNKMTVVDIFPSDDNVRSQLLRNMVLNNDSVRNDRDEVIGEPTEAALLSYGWEHGPLDTKVPRLSEIAFDSSRKMMSTFHPEGKDILAYTKGAPDVLLNRCVLSEKERNYWLKKVEEQAQQGRRVLAFACRAWSELPSVLNPDLVETELTFLGLASLIDPPRPEAGPAVATARSAGIVPIMITGDHPATARAIASELGILYEQDHMIVNGQQLREMNDETLRGHINRIRVYARVSPEQKVRIVDALQTKGYFAAMTGDGVNDAPAIKRADIGIAMGINGTDVAREASDMVLLDDQFATIVHAVKEGRRIYDNIRKFIRYVLTGNTAEIMAIFVAPFLGMPLPLLPVHILWVNLVTDGLPGIALSFERSESDVMARKPRPPHENIFAGGLGIAVLSIGIWTGMLTLGVQWWGLKTNTEAWQTMVFSTLSFAQMFFVMSIRSDTLSIFSMRLYSNRWMVYFMVPTILLQLAVIYVPVLNKLLKTTPLSLKDLCVSLFAASLVIPASELIKYWQKRKQLPIKTII